MPIIDVSAVVNKNNNTVKILFSDNGIGIGKKGDNFESLFTIFQRQHPQEKYAGAGVGLTVCRRICQRHGGSISADAATDTGQGTCITVELPIKGFTKDSEVDDAC